MIHRSSFRQGDGEDNEGKEGMRLLEGLGDGLVELLALGGGDAELESRGLARAVRAGDSTSTEGRATVHLGVVSELLEDVLVSEGNEDDAVVREGGHAGEVDGFLASTLTGSADEETSVLAHKGTGSPKSTSGVPEDLELSRPVTETRADTEKEGVVLWELGSFDHRVRRLRWRIHLLENLFRERFGDLVDIDAATGGLDASLFSLGHLDDMAVKGVENDRNFGSHWIQR